MITIFIGLFVACGSFAASFYFGEIALPWSIALGVLSFIVFQVLVGFLLRKKLSADMMVVQGILLEGQKKVQQKTSQWAFRPPSSIQAAQKEIFNMTSVFVREAIKETERLNKYRGWVPFINRQKATAQLQLNWMIKNFDKVDELMPRVFLADPSLVAMKIARLQMLNAPIEEITKVYLKHIKRLKYNQNALLAACYSWILVKRGLVDEAFKALTNALKNSDNETLKTNHEHLMNNRVSHFSNSNFGDAWYSLMLEEPRVRTQRQHGNKFA